MQDSRHPLLSQTKPPGSRGPGGAGLAGVLYPRRDGRPGGLGWLPLPPSGGVSEAAGGCRKNRRSQIKAQRGPFPNKGSQWRPFLSRLNSPNAFQAPQPTGGLFRGEVGGGNYSTNGVGGASAFLQQPRGRSIYFKRKQTKNPMISNILFSVQAPFWVLQDVHQGGNWRAKVGLCAPPLPPLPPQACLPSSESLRASPVIYEACRWPCSGCSFPGQSPALIGCTGTEATAQTSRPLSARSLAGGAGSAGGRGRPPGLEPSTGPAFSGGLREGHGPDPSWGQRLGRDLRFSSELCPLPLLLPQLPGSLERAAGLGTSTALHGALPVPRAGVPTLDSPAVFSSCPSHL